MTTTPAPKGADIERFRPGFEAWARGEGFVLDRDGCGSYYVDETQVAWKSWAAAKRESVSSSGTSTSQGAEGGTGGAQIRREGAETRMDSDSAVARGVGLSGNSGVAPGDALDAESSAARTNPWIVLTDGYLILSRCNWMYPNATADDDGGRDEARNAALSGCDGDIVFRFAGGSLDKRDALIMIASLFVPSLAQAIAASTTQGNK